MTELNFPNITAVFISVDHSRGEWHSPLYHFDKCLLQMVGTLHATSVRKKEEGRRKKR
ncbi:MAG: hypothetical protein F6K17_34735, partial [Okeania sp. SIO3C4]|nr:hypothetical protein [Okeania sp. SIO3C4]